MIARALLLASAVAFFTSPVVAGTITVTVTTSAGSVTQSATVADADITRLANGPQDGPGANMRRERRQLRYAHRRSGIAGRGITRLAELSAKRAGGPVPVWHFKDDRYGNPNVEHVGLVADDVAAMDKRCGTYDTDGKLKNYEDRCVLAYAIAELSRLQGVVEKQQHEIAELKAR